MDSAPDCTPDENRISWSGPVCPVQETKGLAQSVPGQKMFSLVRSGPVLFPVGSVQSEDFFFCRSGLMFSRRPGPVTCFRPSNGSGATGHKRSNLQEYAPDPNAHRTRLCTGPHTETGPNGLVRSSPVQNKSDPVRSNAFVRRFGPVWSGRNIYTRSTVRSGLYYEIYF